MILPIKRDSSGEIVEALHMPALLVTQFNSILRSLVDDMWDTMYNAKGIGLAAPQIGESQQVAVVDVRYSQRSHRNLALINPHVVRHAGAYVADEGCLSVPGKSWPVERYLDVQVAYQDLDGKDCAIDGHALLARALQHEIDHLAGVMCTSLIVGGYTTDRSKL